MEFKKVIDYVEDHKKEYLEKELAENKKKLSDKGYLSNDEYKSSNELLSQLTEMKKFFESN